MSKFFEYISRFFRETLPDFVSDILKSIYEWISLYTLKFFNVLMESFNDIISFILDLNIPFLSQFQDYWGKLPYESLQLLTFFNVPLSISIILSALGIRFLLKFIPAVGTGR